MPKAAPRPCRVHGCPGLTTAGSYCEDHQHLVKRDDDKRPSAAARGYDYNWQKRRRMELRQEPLCRACKENGRITIATDRDHIIPLADGGTNERANLQSLCKSCHSKKTAVQSSGWGSEERG